MQGHRKDGTFKVSKRGKYNAKGLRIDGIWFASQAEGSRYLQLKDLVRDNKIRRLELQPVYQITVKGVPICKYKADFRYEALSLSGSVIGLIVEDVKGMVTDVYAIKKKLVEACHSITIRELKAGKVAAYAGLRAHEII